MLEQRRRVSSTLSMCRATYIVVGVFLLYGSERINMCSEFFFNSSTLGAAQEVNTHIALPTSTYLPKGMVEAHITIVKERTRFKLKLVPLRRVCY